MEIARAAPSVGSVPAPSSSNRHRVCLLQDGYDVGHMGREGAKALLDALLVSDIGENLLEHGQLRSVEGRNMKPCLAHQGKQPHCL